MINKNKTKKTKQVNILKPTENQLKILYNKIFFHFIFCMHRYRRIFYCNHLCHHIYNRLSMPSTKYALFYDNQSLDLYICHNTKMAT